MSIIQTFVYKDLFPDIIILRTVDTKQLIINLKAIQNTTTDCNN